MESKSELKRRVEKWKRKMLKRMPPEVEAIYSCDDYELRKLGYE